MTPVSAKGGERELPCAASAEEAGPAPARPILESTAELKRRNATPALEIRPFSCLRTQETVHGSSAVLEKKRKLPNYPSAEGGKSSPGPPRILNCSSS